MGARFREMGIATENAKCCKEIPKQMDLHCISHIKFLKAMDPFSVGESESKKVGKKREDKGKEIARGNGTI